MVDSGARHSRDALKEEKPMSWETIRYNRNTLYEQVWSQPILILAKSYGVSNVGLAKICRRLRVPLPWRGYWAKVSNGESIKRPALSTLRPGEQEEYVVERWAKAKLDGERKAAFDRAAASEKEPEQMVAVPTDLDDAHKLVVQAEKSLRHGRRDDHGRLMPRSPGRLHIRVTPECLDRALRIMDALLKALEVRGYASSAGAEENGSTTVVVLGESLGITMEEVLDCTEHVLTRKEQAEKEKYSWMYSKPTYDYTASGKLALRIVGSPATTGRRTWADGSKQKLEFCLNQFIAALVRVAEDQLAHTLELERERREWQEQERQKLEQQRRKEEQRQRVESLTQQVDNWDRSRKIREFIAEMRELELSSSKKTWKIGEVPLAEWVEWALRYADKIDPVGPIRKACPAVSGDGATLPLVGSTASE